MRVLVTGGAGFIGSNLAERLSVDPRVTAVRVADDFSTGKRENIRAFESRLEIVEGNLLDDAVREKCVNRTDVILHHAALPSVPRSVVDPVASHLAGAHLTLMLLDSARRAGVKRFVYAGSSSAYGDTETLPKLESFAPKPRSPYAVSKLAGEYYTSVFAQCYAMDSVVLRYFNVFGPRQDETSQFSAVIARFCSALQTDQPLVIHADGTQSRDFCYIDNVVEANVLATFHPQPLKGTVLNIGCGERHTLLEMVERLNALSGQKRQPVFGPPRAGDVQHSQAGIERAREILGYAPKVFFEEGLRRTLEWHRQRAGKS